jgi:2-polyprenyl-3-methyl-5-hydroxy-6-metoxy-1,4-benzoquinol methylase
MKLLVAIANYGTGNDQYLLKVLDELRQMKSDVDCVVTSNITKNVGRDVEVIVGLPSKDPRSLPFAHKKVFADRSREYDLFLYTEDDILIKQQNIDALMRATVHLAEGEVAGFIRSETDKEGNIYFPDIHYHYHWQPESVVTRGEYTFASFTNLHSGCYLLTKEQLARVIASGGFLVRPHEGQYEPLETAATDPYTQCGLRKLICISHIEDFIVPHLSNKYAGRGSLPAADFYAQLRRLCRPEKPKVINLPVETGVLHQRWSKSYYELCQDKLIALIPKGSHNVLSIGCGWGVTEKRLIEMGVKVKAAPIDSVIAASAEARGVEIVYGDCKAVHEQLANERFDCLLLSNILHLVQNPVELLLSFADLLKPDGRVVASVPNVTKLRRIIRRLRFAGKSANPRSYKTHGMHITDSSVMRHWFRKAGLKLDRLVYEVSAEKELSDRRSLGLARPMLASEIYMSASRRHAH